MDCPWRVTNDDFEKVQISHPAVSAGRWDDVESYLGLILPDDYKALVGDAGALVLDEELFIASPFETNPRVSLLHVIADMSYAEAYVRHHSPVGPTLSIYPEAGGLVCWGLDGGGGIYWWDTVESDPQQWTVVVTGRSVEPPERHDLSLVEYLDALASGVVPAAALSDWPTQGSTVRPI